MYCQWHNSKDVHRMLKQLLNINLKLFCYIQNKTIKWEHRQTYNSFDRNHRSICGYGTQQFTSYT